MVKEIEDAIVSINGCEGPFHPSPFIFPVNRDTGVCVVEEGVRYQPKRKPQGGEHIPESHMKNAVVERHLG